MEHRKQKTPNNLDLKGIPQGGSLGLCRFEVPFIYGDLSRLVPHQNWDVKSAIPNMGEFRAPNLVVF